MAVDYSLVVKIAEVMKENGADQFVVISAMGANSSSKIFYNRVKGEMEEAVKRIGYQSVKILRPSLLLGHRKEFRLAERIGVWLSPLINLLLVGSLKMYAPISPTLQNELDWSPKHMPISPSGGKIMVGYIPNNWFSSPIFVNKVL